jgi:hypothetical protein
MYLLVSYHTRVVAKSIADAAILEARIRVIFGSNLVAHTRSSGGIRH